MKVNKIKQVVSTSGALFTYRLTSDCDIELAVGYCNFEDSACFFLPEDLEELSALALKLAQKLRKNAAKEPSL